MIQPLNSAIFGVLAALSSGCSLLQDAGSLSSGYGDRVSTAGASGGGVGGGSAAACEPTNSDAYCDGLDQNCEPTLQESACPTGCKAQLSGGVSYMGCTVSATFSDAEILCEEQRMHLVEIDSASENNFVAQIAQTLGSYVWIGGSDLQLNSTFTWTGGTVFYTDGAPVPGVFQNFAPGQPVVVVRPLG